jgi:hypothetical protein
LKGSALAADVKAANSRKRFVQKDSGAKQDLAAAK